MRRSFAIVCALALSLTVAVSAAAQGRGVVVELKKQVSVSGAIVTLADVAKLSGDETLIAQAGKVMLGRVPANVTGKDIAAETVRERLMANGIAVEDFEVKDGTVKVYDAAFVVIKEETPAPKIETAPQTKPVASEGVVDSFSDKPALPIADDKPAVTDVVELAIAEIRKLTVTDLKLDEKDVEVIEVTRNQALRSLPAGEQRLKDVDVGDNGGPLGRRIFRLTVDVGGKLYRDLVLTVTVSRYASVVVPVRDVAAKSVITSNDVRLERRAFDTRAENYLTSIEAATGYAPRQALRAGTVIEPQSIEPAALIKRGQKVTVKAGLASFNGEALEDGTMGQTVRVSRPAIAKDENGNAGKSVELVGRVMSDGSVVVGK